MLKIKNICEGNEKPQMKKLKYHKWKNWKTTNEEDEKL